MLHDDVQLLCILGIMVAHSLSCTHAHLNSIGFLLVVVVYVYIDSDELQG